MQRVEIVPEISFSITKLVSKAARSLTGVSCLCSGASLFYMVNALKFEHYRSMPKMPRPTGQTQIRLLLQKQSDQGLPCLLL